MPATIIMAVHRILLSRAVIPADVGPLQSIGRPYPAPAVVIVAVVGVGVGDANERKATEAVVEEEAVIECSVRKAR